MNGELPSFYHDAEKKRYFPIKGPIPGSASSHSKPPPKPFSKLQLQPQHGNIVLCGLRNGAIVTVDVRQ